MAAEGGHSSYIEMEGLGGLSVESPGRSWSTDDRFMMVKTGEVRNTFQAEETRHSCSGESQAAEQEFCVSCDSE